MQIRCAGRFSASSGRSNTVPPSFARFSNTSMPRERLFPHTAPSYDAYIRSLRSDSEHASKTRPFSKLRTPFLSRFSFVRSFDTRACLSQRSRQTPPLSFTSSFWPHPLSRLGGAYCPERGGRRGSPWHTTTVRTIKTCILHLLTHM